MNPLWPHQHRAIQEIDSAIAAGVKRIVITSPTGGGKSRIILEVADAYLRAGKRVILYTNRRMLLAQISEVMEAAGLPHGIRASGYKDDRGIPFQLSSTQTEAARVLRQNKWEVHQADLVFFDEYHLHNNETGRDLISRHLEKNGIVLGFTATPLGLSEIADHLIQAGTMSELRACGALVPAHHFGPDEPDLRHIGKVQIGEDLTERQQQKAMGELQTDNKPTPKLAKLFGRIYEHYNRLNPEQKPTILFAPGVRESVWFAEQFQAAGIPSAHIDGQDVWLQGEFFPSSKAVREEVLSAFKFGEIKIITNRFVLREGIDIPAVEHLILATVVGSLQSYIQAGGRGLRASPGKEHCIIQDHGGNWHRHGSLNADRHWELEQTSQFLTAYREERLRKKEEREPFPCPQCSRILTTPVCPECGYQLDIRRRSRMVVQANGDLKEMWGDIYKPRVTRMEPDTEELWKRQYYRARNGNLTFRQARALFWMDHGYWPPEDLRLMPRRTADWCAKVGDVPRGELH